MSFSIANPQVVFVKSKKHTVTPVTSTVYKVLSGTSMNTYRVIVEDHGAECTCKWGYYRPRSDKRSACSHVQAVYGLLAQKAGRSLQVRGTVAEAIKTKRKYHRLGDGVVLISRYVTRKADVVRFVPAPVNADARIAELLGQLGF